MTLTIPAASRRGRRLIRNTIAGISAAALLTSAACSGSDSTTGPGKNTRDPSGLYALMTVGKNAIPTQIYRGPYWWRGLYYIDDLMIHVTGGELVLEPGGSFHLAVDLRFATASGELSDTRSYDGTYSVRGGDIVFSDATSSVTGSLQNGNVVVKLDAGDTDESQTYRFQFVP
jgi:hypothetical protein